MRPVSPCVLPPILYIERVMHSHFATCPEFACDDAADLAAAVFAPVPPRVYDVAPGFVPAFVHLHVVQITDPEFLRTVDMQLALVLLSGRLAPVYAPTVNTARGARHMGYSEGVRKPAHRMTRAEKIAAEDRKWGLRA